MKPQGLPLVNVARKWLLLYKKPYSVVVWGLQIVDGIKLLSNLDLGALIKISC
jgi:hypothetical protein